MAQQLIGLGTTANDRTGDDWRSGGTKINANFTELYANGNGTTIYLSAEADFPNQDASFIYLDAGFNYTPITSFSCTKTIVFQGGRIVGIGKRLGVTLTYSGTGTQFSAVGFNLQISDLAYSAPSGTHFAFTSTGVHFLTLDSVTSSACVNHGTITQAAGINLFQYTAIASAATTGFVFAGTSGIITVDTFATVGAPSGYKTFDFGTSVFSGVKFTQFFQDTTRFSNNAGSIAISGLANSGNVASGGLITVDTCNFVGLTAPFTNITSSDVRWDVMNSPPLVNSSKEADVYLTASQTVTITVTSQFEAVAGALWVSEVAERFTTSTAGAITFSGERDIKAHITLIATVEKSGGGADEIDLAISINDVVTGGGFTKTIGSTQNANPTTVISQRLATISAGDVIKAEVANDTGTANIIVSRANLTVFEV